MSVDANISVGAGASVDVECTLSPLAAAVLSAANQADRIDTRSVAKLLQVGHALVIRECTVLAEEAGLLEICSRNPKTQRLEVRLTASGRQLVAVLAS